ncbi:hypothetical protein SRHO_G00064940 [Serrasalmus rhombeus]
MLVQDFIPRWGLPEQIESDQGTHFTGQVVQAVYKLLKVNWKLHCPYRPQASGQNHTAETVSPSTQNTAWTSRCLVDSSRNVHLKKICAADWRRGRDLEDDLPSSRRCQVHQDNMNTSQIQTLCMIITMICGSNAWHCTCMPTEDLTFHHAEANHPRSLTCIHHRQALPEDTICFWHFCTNKKDPVH